MIFGEDWWMDAVSAGKRWERLCGVPMLLRRRLGFRYVLMPQLTQLNDCPDSVCAADLDQALRGLHLAYYYQQFPIDSPVPDALRPLGYRVRDRITYRIEDTGDLDAVLRGFNKNKLRQLRKAKCLQIVDTMTPDRFYHYHRIWLQGLLRNISYTESFFTGLYNACVAHDAGKIIALAEPDGDVVGAVFLIWDRETLYYLMPCYDPEHKDAGIGSRLVWEAVQEAHRRHLVFDFEGSMVPGIARHYRQFGSIERHYQSVERCFNPLFKILLAIQKWRTRRVFTSKARYKL